jgi:hypothetical protein
MHDIKSCSDLTKNGIVESGEFDLDLIPGHKPVKAWCNLPEGETVLGQNTSIEIGHCTGSGCFQEELTYDNSLEEIAALINASSDCRQDITFNCNLAPLQVKIFIHKSSTYSPSITHGKILIHNYCILCTRRNNREPKFCHV